MELALTHRSYSAENNERLEFLGDAVLDLVLSDVLFQLYPSVDEGSLSLIRASIVNERSLSALARQLGINEQIILGEGESLSGGQERDSILANTLEAITLSQLSLKVIIRCAAFKKKFLDQCLH